MPSLAHCLALATVALPAAVVAFEEPACTGDSCGVGSGLPEGEEAAMLQVHRANESGSQGKGGFTNPCGMGYTYLPKQSVQKDCEAAGLKYTGNKNAAEDASNCCVKATWVCNLGTKKECKSDGVADPTFLGTITWDDFEPRGNCCVPPNPSTSKTATWAFDTQFAPKQKYCKSKKISHSCTIHAFWTGAKCMTTANVDGEYQMPTCQKSWGKCKGLSLGSGMCCSCPE